MNNIKLWEKQSKQWNFIGAPQRPQTEDVKIFIRHIQREKNIRSALILGLTPEIIKMGWNQNAELIAVDNNSEMIKALWEKNYESRNIKVLEADWRCLPIESSFFDVVIGDGVTTAIGTRDATRELLSEISRVLRGSLILRIFIRPDEVEKIENIVADCKENKIKNFGSLKWRLAMALVEKNTSSVDPMKVLETFQLNFSNRELLSERTGWTLPEINSIDSYKEMVGKLYFPEKQEIENLLSEFFTIEMIEIANYELARNCPTYVLKKNGKN